MTTPGEITTSDAIDTGRPRVSVANGRTRFATMRHSLMHLIRFGFTSGLSFLAITGGTFALHELAGVNPEASFGIALAAVFILNFLLLRYYVFPGQTADLRKQLFACVLVSLIFRSTEYSAFLVVHSWWGVQYMLTSVLVLIGSFMAKFTVLRFFVFTVPDPRAPDVTPVSPAKSSSIPRSDDIPDQS